MCNDERQSGYESMGSILQSLKDYYPDTAKAINSTLVPTAKAQLEADQSVSPGYAQLNLDLYKNYGPEAARTAAQIDDITQQAASDRELKLAQGTGRQLVTEADLAQKKLDPEFYKQREALSGSMSKYLTNADPSLTENEREEMRRGMGSTPGNPDSAIDTAINAGRFGEKFNQKNQAFGQAIGTVAAALPNMRSGINGFEVATRRALNSNTGDARVGSASTNAGNNTYGMASNFMNAATATQTTAQNKQLSMWDKLNNINNYISTATSVAGKAAMCWVARAAYGESNFEWLYFRRWMILRSPDWLFKAYRTYGEALGKVVSRFAVLRAITRFIMNPILKGVR